MRTPSYNNRPSHALDPYEERAGRRAVHLFVEGVGHLQRAGFGAQHPAMDDALRTIQTTARTVDALVTSDEWEAA